MQACKTHRALAFSIVVAYQCLPQASAYESRSEILSDG